jgi:hypothetical protein
VALEPRSGCGKAHHTWGHRGWNNRNAKRKTTRTHRDGSRKNYRLKEPRGSREETVIHARRKKRFGGKEHRKREYSFHPVTGRFNAWWEITKPDLDG